MVSKQQLPAEIMLRCPAQHNHFKLSFCFLGSLLFLKYNPFLRTMNDLHCLSVTSEPSHNSAHPINSPNQTAEQSGPWYSNHRGSGRSWCVPHTGVDKDHSQQNCLAKLVPCPEVGLFACRGFLVLQVESKPKVLLSCPAQ